MPSIFTLGGPMGSASKKPRRKRAKKSKASGKECRIGDCKPVRNKRTGKTIDLCCVGKAKSRSGWLFRSKKG